MMTLLVTIVHAFAQEILTNETIVTLVKAGIGEELIVSKIKTSQNQFDVSTDGILKLKNEGVNKNIIKTMLEASKPNVSTPPEPSGVGRMIISNLYLKKDEKMVTIAPAKAEITSGYPWKQEWIPFYIGHDDVYHFVREKNP